MRKEKKQKIPYIIVKIKVQYNMYLTKKNNKKMKKYKFKK